MGKTACIGECGERVIPRVAANSYAKLLNSTFYMLVSQSA